VESAGTGSRRQKAAILSLVRRGAALTCWNALDRHVAAGNGERVALVWEPGHRQIVRFTYRALRDRVARLPASSRDPPKTGDRVLIYMPLVPEAAIAMLACARIGAIHSVVFGGFASHELATRIDDAKPRVVVSASCGIEIARVIPYKPLLDAAIAEARSKPEACVVLQRPMCQAELVPGRDHDWDELEAAAQPVDCVPVMATDPLYILYTSGTTGIPKGVVRDNGGHAVALHWSMRHVYGLEPDEAYWAASTSAGRSVIPIRYAPIYGCTSIMYEESRSAPRRRRVAAGHRRARRPRAVHCADRVPRRPAAGSDGLLIGKYDLSRFRSLRPGRRARRSADRQWAEEKLKVRSSIIGGRPRPAGRSAPIASASSHCRSSTARPAVPGWDVRVLEAEAAWPGQRMKPGEIGALAIKPPLPPGALRPCGSRTAIRRLNMTAYPGFYQTADAGDRRGRLHPCNDLHRRHHQCRRPSPRPAAWRRFWRRIDVANAP
jgi:propionyl-CoA synthetase